MLALPVGECDMSIQIGTAPDSWGVWAANDPEQVPWQRFLDEVVEAGYEWIELGPYGYLPTALPTLRPELDRRGLKVSASFVMAHLEESSKWPDLEQQVLRTGELIAALGGKFLVLIDDVHSDLYTGTPYGPTQLDESAWKRLIETTHKVADISWEHFRLDLVFHPHVETHVEYEEQIETLLAQTDPERVGLCLDTGHYVYRDGNLAAFVRRHQERITYLHLKNVDIAVQQEVKLKRIPFAVAVGMGVFCEPSLGMVDFIAFRDLLNEIQYSGWAIVEQDMHPAPLDKPLPVAKRTRAYLRQIGIG
jgi:inosose dehydratase